MTNEIEKIEFQIVDTNLPILTSNFDEVKANLAQYLTKYDIEVMHETVKDAKKLATELNSICKRGEDGVKEKLKVFEAPINVVKSQLKEIVNLYQDTRLKITNQVKVFEDKTRAKCGELLKVELQEQYTKLNIKDEFRTVAVDDLVIISNVTDSGNLAKSARDAISERVHSALSLQNLVHVRLVELENASLKAGLKSPLERRHVESFLKSDDEIYKTQLNKLFENEVKRQNEIEEKIKAEQKKEQERREAEIRAEEERKHKAELDRIQKEQVEKQRLEIEAKVKEVEVKPNPSEIPKNPTTKESLDVAIRIDTFIITATFKVQIESSKMATTDIVKGKFVKTLADRGFETVQNVEVNKIG